MINVLDNTPNQPSKFRTKHSVKINYDSQRTYDSNSQIKFKTLMLKSSLRDYADVYILVSGTITVSEAGGKDAAKDSYRNNKQQIFKTLESLIDCIAEINNTSDFAELLKFL